VDDTPHHLAGGTAKPTPRLAPVYVDYSQYCVVRIGEYVEMREEIERLRAEIIATRAERDAAQTQADHLAKRLVQEARRG
jgi:uncharacterized small protein (DUF1192 family)